jgi:hypothetical protein
VLHQSLRAVRNEKPRFVHERVAGDFASKEHHTVILRRIDHAAGPATAWFRTHLSLKPGGSIPGPRIVETLAGNIESTEYHYLPVVLVAGNNGRELTGTKLEEWVAGFPIEVDDGRTRPRRLSSP